MDKQTFIDVPQMRCLEPDVIHSRFPIGVLVSSLARDVRPANEHSSLDLVKCKMTALTTRAAEAATLGSHRIEDYAPLVGGEAVDRILKKAARVQGLHIVHVSSTFYGGGVAEILTPLTLLMNEMGIDTGWRMIQ